MLRSINIGIRIIMLVAFLILCIALVSALFTRMQGKVMDYNLGAAQEIMLEGEKHKLTVAVDSMAISLSTLIDTSAPAAIQEEALRAAVDAIRFEDDKSGYFFIFTGTTNVALPAKKSVVGTDMGAARDANGIQFITELSKAAEAGGGFVEYIFDKPGKGLQPKLAYARYIPGTKYWLGTGVYIDNIEAQKEHIAASAHEIENSEQLVLYSILAALMLLVVAPVCVGIILSITRPLGKTTDAAQEIASGNLDVTLDEEGKDEISRLQRSLNQMVTQLVATIEDVKQKEAEANRQAEAARQATEQTKEAMEQAKQATRQGMLAAAQRLEGVVNAISEATGDIDHRSTEISNGTQMQVARINETATAMEEMNATVMEVARNASEAAEQTNSSREKALEGAQVVSATVTAMNQLKNLAGDLKDNMHQLGQQSESIGAIINVINDIADQTNLLALNAAIEAARAGDAGRGFAVVADEVRKLAEKTMTATKEVGDSIRSIQSLARTNVEGMDEASKAIDNAATLSASSGQMLEEIVAMAQEAAGQVQSIATAAEEQSAASEEITRSVEEVNNLAQDNGRMVGETVQDVSQLVEQATTLSQLVEELKR
ncbi:methyl-accepting chemotaxis protein [Oleidesulfovibrio sp.]|uniref:methyl-accepting chemotaxis protein n=1 Tax=Oleidesulfovibrio sp. TaxID=2909707 RepID=UPI003A8A4105